MVSVTDSGRVKFGSERCTSASSQCHGNINAGTRAATISSIQGTACILVDTLTLLACVGVCPRHQAALLTPTWLSTMPRSCSRHPPLKLASLYSRCVAPLRCAPRSSGCRHSVGLGLAVVPLCAPNPICQGYRTSSVDGMQWLHDYMTRKTTMSTSCDCNLRSGSTKHYCGKVKDPSVVITYTKGWSAFASGKEESSDQVW